MEQRATKQVLEPGYINGALSYSLVSKPGRSDFQLRLILQALSKSYWELESNLKTAKELQTTPG